jgi:uncharacterized protein YegP (UPF0339 family)
MNQLFLQLAQSVTGNVITIVALELGAAIIGFIIAWYYARSVYTPVIKGLEADKTNLNNKVAGLRDDIGSLNEKSERLGEKISKLEEELAAKDNEIKELSSQDVPVGKFAVGIAKSGENYFNLKATNGQTILTSVMYSSRDDCTNGIESVRANCNDDERYERRTSANNKHFFNLKTSDGQLIGKSEMYESVTNMEKGIASVKRNGSSTIVVEGQD